jgi:hypothetical protein
MIDIVLLAALLVVPVALVLAVLSFAVSPVALVAEHDLPAPTRSAF